LQCAFVVPQETDLALLVLGPSPAVCTDPVLSEFGYAAESPAPSSAQPSPCSPSNWKENGGDYASQTGALRTPGLQPQWQPYGGDPLQTQRAKSEPSRLP
jgi:hypothetical protein